jgi:hypothetical protein
MMYSDDHYMNQRITTRPKDNHTPDLDVDQSISLTASAPSSPPALTTSSAAAITTTTTAAMLTQFEVELDQLRHELHTQQQHYDALLAVPGIMSQFVKTVVWKVALKNTDSVNDLLQPQHSHTHQHPQSHRPPREKHRQHHQQQLLYISDPFAYHNLLWCLHLFTVDLGLPGPSQVKGADEGKIGLFLELLTPSTEYLSLEVKFSLLHEEVPTFAKKRMQPFLFGPSEPCICGLGNFVDAKTFLQYVSHDASHPSSSSSEMNRKKTGPATDEASLEVVISARLSIPPAHLVQSSLHQQASNDSILIESPAVVDDATTTIDKQDVGEDSDEVPDHLFRGQDSGKPKHHRDLESGDDSILDEGRKRVGSTTRNHGQRRRPFNDYSSAGRSQPQRRRDMPVCLSSSCWGRQALSIARRRWLCGSARPSRRTQSRRSRHPSQDSDADHKQGHRRRVDKQQVGYEEY